MKNIPWTEREDADISSTYQMANGGFPTYAAQAAQINRVHHEGKPIRTARSVSRREGHVVFKKPFGRQKQIKQPA